MRICSNLPKKYSKENPISLSFWMQPVFSNIIVKNTAKKSYFAFIYNVIMFYVKDKSLNYQIFEKWICK